MKKVLLYYPFTLSEEANSGSKLRPLEMKRAFEQWTKEHGLGLLFISGTSRQREEQFERMKKEGQLDDLLFCYMENQTIPIWLTDPGHKPQRLFADKKILSFLKQRNVPVGIFYRDIYWKFDELYPLKGVKKKIMQAVYRMEEKFFEKYADVVFVPSLEMGEYVSIGKPMADLPPGGKARPSSRRTRGENSCEAIYVGAIKSVEYGLPLLLESLEEANKKNIHCRLTIVCRKEEFEGLEDTLKVKISNLGVRLAHISGKELDSLYGEMDFAFIPRLCTEYQNFSMPVKLVEYLSNGLPIVATSCKAQERFIGENGYGVICDDDKTSMAGAIGKMAENLELFKANIEATFLQNHSWLARVEKVKKELAGE